MVYRGSPDVCIDDDETPDTTTLRTALIMHRLDNGERFTTAEAAAVMGVSMSGAYKKLDLISSCHKIPLAFVDGYWIMLLRGRDFPY